MLNAVFRDRPKFIALGVSMLGDGRAAERVFRELLVALDERPERFDGEEELGAWCWKALRNRLMNLVQRGDGRRLMLPGEVLDQLDQELELRDGAELADQAEALDICLSDLSHRARWTAHLYYAKDKGGLETARLMNLRPGNLYRDLQRIYAGGTNCLLKRIAMGRTPIGRVRARNAEFERLVFRYLDDELAEEGILQLSEAFASDPDRVRQFNDIRLYSVLVRDSAVLGSLESDSFSIPSGPLDLRLTRSMMVSLVSAVVILSVLVGTLALIKLNPSGEPVATLVKGAGAKFAAGRAPNIGDSLDGEKYVLSTGTIQLRFGKAGHGAEVNIDAPAAFRVDSKDKLFLEHGTLLAMVPRDAIGFEVETKLGTVRDLGTEFGVSVQKNGAGLEAQMVVFQGEVEVSGHGATKRALLAGAGISIRPDEIKTLAAAEHAYRYPHSLPTSDGASSRGGMVTNFSFEVGPLSRVPHASHRYRAIPSHWVDGCFVHNTWSRQVEVSGLVHAGTLATPVDGSDDVRPPEGVRCLFLNSKAAVRQPIEHVLPGGQYKLRFKVASPEDAAGAAYRVGFLADNRWVASEQGEVEGGTKFVEVEKIFSMPDDAALANKPVYLTLSSDSGLIFFDEVYLTSLFGDQ